MWGALDRNEVKKSEQTFQALTFSPTHRMILPITQSTGLTPVSGTTYQNTYYFTAYLGPSAGSLQAVLQAATPAGGGQHGYP